MKALAIGALVALAISSAASAATIVTIHAEGTATGHLASLGIIYPYPNPITMDATFDLAKGTQTTNIVVDRIEGSGANSPGEADVSIESFGLLAETGWGNPFASMSFLTAPTYSTLSINLMDPTTDRVLYLLINRPGSLFTSLDTIPVGEVCAGATICVGGIVDPDGGTAENNLGVSWSTVRFSMTDTAVPEPSTWALMILGFGGVGTMLRSRRRRLAFA